MTVLSIERNVMDDHRQSNVHPEGRGLERLFDLSIALIAFGGALGVLLHHRRRDAERALRAWRTVVERMGGLLRVVRDHPLGSPRTEWRGAIAGRSVTLDFVLEAAGRDGRTCTRAVAATSSTDRISVDPIGLTDAAEEERPMTGDARYDTCFAVIGDPRLARRLVPAIRSTHLDHPVLGIELQDGRVLVHAPGIETRPATIHAMLELASAVASAAEGASSHRRSV